MTLSAARKETFQRKVLKGNGIFHTKDYLDRWEHETELGRHFHQSESESGDVNESEQEVFIQYGLHNRITSQHIQ